jgi:3-hydroxyacyl-CoA dehydrogenase / enoyl-CoA hydratase / 3-hydroxybutyryl-CoA epimerase / enoyl-CoA isomerase
MAADTLSLSMAEPDIAVLTLDTPNKGANVLSNSVLDELAKHLDTLEQRSDIVGLVFVSAKPGIFIAGADLREFVTAFGSSEENTVTMCQRGQNLFARLSKAPFITVAAINGICVGGGAELAGWCDRRLFSNNPKAELGFPEVKLGLYPGWGGTVRAPRIVGLSNAVEMITGGESLSAVAAYEMGWASDLVPDDELLPAAIQLVRDEQTSKNYLKDRERWSGPVDITETELGFLGATASAMIRQQTKGHYPAPDLALEVMLESALLDSEAACRREAEGMAKLFGSPVNRSLLNVFFLTDRNKKDTGVDKENVATQSISSVTVIGAGIMGGGIAGANVKRGIPVALTDANAESLAKGGRQVLEEAAFDRKLKGPSADKMLKLAPLLNTTTSEEEVAASDLVIEAVIENEEVKRSIYSQLESQMRPDAILASNTSTIPITKLAEGLARPEQFCGIHFFNPVRRMKLVEVIRGEKTSDETIATAVAYAKRVGKFPIAMNDGPGFLVNRLLFPYMLEAIELLCDGASMKAIDRASKQFGMPMGPIELYDLVGIDTAVYGGQTMAEAFPDRVVSSDLLPAMVAANRLGKKSGRGFFSYNNKKGRPEPDPLLAEVLGPHIRGQREFTLDELTSRLFLPMFLEATRILEDGIVRDPRDIDLGLIFGIGFPPFKGGLMFWADSLGAATIVEMLKPFESLGKRMAPTDLLLEMAAHGTKFYK